MTDSTLNRFISQGTSTARVAFTPSPPTPASGPNPLYIWNETDTGAVYVWSIGSSAWVSLVGPVVINGQTGTGYTLVLSDMRKMVTMNNASANTLTIPLNATVAFPIGTTISIQQTGVGKTTIAATGGVTLNFVSTLTAAIVGQYGVAQLIKIGTDTWTLFGAIGG